MTAGALQRAAQTIGALRTRLDAAEAMVEQARVPLVILGLSVRVPGGVVDAVGYWGVLRSGVDVTSEVPEYR
ncbi:hypothetical protein, partial [Roseomonas sp. CECT 9278]|uniref:hypothetical protein n=1 Tax=Roseomonas sp. CECT 9278 TaxID=2845823 RepID=UPI001E36CFB2